MAASGSRSVRFAEDVDAASAPLFSLESPGSSPRPSYEQPRPPPGAAASGSTPPRLPLAHGLRSTMSSREAQFDADSDELSDSDAAAADLGASPGRAAPSSGGMRTGIPLIDRIPVPVRARQSMDGLSDGLEGIRNQIQDIELPDWLKKGAGVWDATVNMANSILGAGVVGLPYSLRTSGFVAGLGLLVGLAMLTDWTIRLIVLNAKLSGRTTYIDIMSHCFGGNGKAAVSIFQFAFAFGGMCAFCVVIGDTIPNVLRWLFPSLVGSFLSSRGFIITLCTLCISYPLSLYRDIESLSKASAIALFSMVLIIVAVIVRGPAMPLELRGDPSERFTFIHPSGIVRSIAVISFAFVCHHNSLLIYGSLKEPSMDKFKRVTNYSTAIAAVSAISMSVAGYWSFTDKTLGNILNNFPEDDTMVNLARFLFGVNMFTTFPLEAFVAREVIEEYFFAGEFDQTRHLIFTTSLVLSSLIVSLSTCDLGIVLELTGGLSATALAFIFPSICFLKLASDSSASAGAERNVPELTSASSRSRRVGRGSEDADDESDADLSDLEGEAGGGGDFSVDDVELPLRPGASVRQRAPGGKSKWWMSTKPLAVATAIFGCVVLVISVAQALGDAASGRSGAVHQC
ncbi:hypothetical protein FA09DRAFT_332951 [Tilletiopsis washingtonensis]|uniref:Amino acid transporter transmembrane domain-containing protein n=1 Tax=Tilletiopsis washingtonensis TaxID=58919 RepID=A0A316Z2S0_9BASI|nr:hypothetical protein FA09DRAFT_332951 [Tilletiopsis washingtonensis]PWN94483.1 hypothetical protein FA09DRAFT_332951 [Tilletiopsis washingtonensis]